MWVKRYTTEKSLDTHFKNCHGQRKTTESLDMALVNKAKEIPFTTLRELKAEVAHRSDISLSTIRRRLIAAGLKNRIPAQQTVLTRENIRARLAFCEANRGRDWDKVVFSDEKTFQSSVNRKKSLWRPDNQRYNPRYVQSRRFSGRVTCGVWGYITFAGPGELCEIESRLNSTQYKTILEEYYIPSMKVQFQQEARNFIFMQDNSPVHKSADATLWFRTHPEIELLKWPAYSPDLNPIENVWAEMVRLWPEAGLRNRNQIIHEAQKLWNGLRGSDLIPKLFDSMDKRLGQVINNNGNWCKY